MRHRMMLKRLEEKRHERLSKLAQDGASYKSPGLKGKVISTLEIQNANRILMQNQYKNKD